MKGKPQETQPIVLKAAAVYTGLPRLCSHRFGQFPSHPLYAFPLFTAKSSAEVTLKSNKFTEVTQVSTLDTLTMLHEASPFRRGAVPEIAPASGSFSFSEGREAPMNTVNTDSSQGSHRPEEKRTKDLEDSGSEDSFEASPIRTPPIRTAESSRADSLQEEFGLKKNQRHSIKAAIRDYSEDIPSDEEAQGSVSSSDAFADRLVRLSTNKDFKRIVELIPEEMEEDSVMMFRSVEALKQAGVIKEEESEADVDISAEQIHLVPRETQVKANKPSCDMQQVKPKLLGDSTIFFTTMNESMLLTADVSDGHSPLCKKLIVCEEVRRSVAVESRETVGKRMEVAAALACAGCKTCVGLEFSNVEGKSRAVVDYAAAEEQLPVRLLTPSILRFFMSNPVQWISCGFEHCAVVTVEGEVFTWGYGGSGALGHGNTLSYATPTRVQALAAQGIAYLECGGYHNAAFNTAGKLWMWGRGDVNQLGVSFKKLIHDEFGCLALSPIEVEEFSRWRRSVQGVACGEAHTLVLDSAGSVYAFGWAEDGQLGLPDSAISEGKMTTKVERIEGIPKAVKVAAGSLFSLILTDTGNVYSWGNGEQGQLGQGSKALRRPRPSQLPSISSETIVDVVCGENYALAMSQEGTVYGWGRGLAGVFEGGQFMKGSELVCYVPRELAEVEITQHLAVFRVKKKASAEQPSFLWALEEELRRLEQDD